MSRRFELSVVLALWVGVAAVLFAPGNGRTVGATEPAGVARECELFAALADDQIAVTVIPQSFSRLTMIVENRSSGPLTVRLPPVFVAVPQGGEKGRTSAADSGGPYPITAPQTLGGTFAEGGGETGKSAGDQVWEIGPGKKLRKKLACFCLEFGKPDPQPQIPYGLRPFDTFSTNRTLQRILVHYGEGRCSQHVAQLALWQVADDLPWDQLAAVVARRRGGSPALRFTPHEFEQAHALVASLAAETPEPGGP